MPDSAEALAEKVDAKIVLGVLARLREGDFTARMPLEWTGVAGKVADGLDDLIVAGQDFREEVARVSQVVGKEGRLSQRMTLASSTGGWSTAAAGSASRSPSE